MSFVTTTPPAKQFSKIGAGLSIPALYLPTTDSEMDTAVPISDSCVGSGEGNSSPDKIIFSNSARMAGVKSLTFAKIDNTWTKAKERRFHTLAAAIATESISSQERVEYDLLKALRRQKAASISGQELLRQMRERNLLLNIKRSIEEYVEFHRFKNRKKA
jgi:hypothetical protein